MTYLVWVPAIFWWAAFALSRWLGFHAVVQDGTLILALAGTAFGFGMWLRSSRRSEG